MVRQLFTSGGRVPEGGSSRGGGAIPVSIAVHAAAVVAILTVSGARAVVVQEPPKAPPVFVLTPRPETATKAAAPAPAPVRRIVNRVDPDKPIRISSPAPVPPPDLATDPTTTDEIEPNAESASNDIDAYVCLTCIPTDGEGPGGDGPPEVGDVAGGVVPGKSLLEPSRKIHDVAPRYPDPLRRMGIEGVVQRRLRDRSGRPGAGCACVLAETCCSPTPRSRP